MKSAEPSALVQSLFAKHLAVHKHLSHYTGIVSFHGLARLAVAQNTPDLIEKIRAQLLPYVRGEHPYRCNFPNYQCGGNATAYLHWTGHLPEAAEVVRQYAEQIMTEAPRDPDGILCHPQHPGENRVWIDTALGSVPFLLYAGLALKESSYIDEAFVQGSKMVRLLRNPENGLLHQSRGFNGPNRFSEDHWSRGNGWGGAYALAELACYLPANHSKKAEAVALYRDHIEASAKVQDECGLWHQEMTEPTSYIETSGSALLLYEIGLGLQHGILSEAHRERFTRGLSELLLYITEDYDVFHACESCLCPGSGTKLEYMAKRTKPNDRHSFGPAILIFAQAVALGINHVTRPS